MRFALARLSAVFLVLLLTASIAHAGDASGLYGKWKHASPNGSEITLTFLPDGSFVYQLTFPTIDPITETATFTLDGDALTLSSDQGDDKSRVVIEADKLTLIARETQVYDRIASADDVKQELAAREEAVAKENDGWKNVFPLDKVRPGKTEASGAMPADPKPEHVFEDSAVFAKVQGYLWNGPKYELAQPGPNNGQSTMRYDLLPTGRLFAYSVKYSGPVAGVEHVTFSELKNWGRYQVVADDQGEAIRIEFDDGTTSLARLVDGRRSLEIVGGQSLNNITWEQAMVEHGSSTDVPIPDPVGQDQVAPDKVETVASPTTAPAPH